MVFRLEKPPLNILCQSYFNSSGPLKIILYRDPTTMPTNTIRIIKNKHLSNKTYVFKPLILRYLYFN